MCLMLNDIAYVYVCFSAMNNLARSIHVLDRSGFAGAQSVAKCIKMTLQLPLYHTVRNLAGIMYGAHGNKDKAHVHQSR